VAEYVDLRRRAEVSVPEGRDRSPCDGKPAGRISCCDDEQGLLCRHSRPITLDGHRLPRLHRGPTLPSQHHFGINIPGSARGRAPRMARTELGSRCRLRRTATMSAADGRANQRKLSFGPAARGLFRWRRL
jgi:hypothetical protein